LARVTTGIVAAAIVAAGVLAASPTAAAARPVIYVVPPGSISSFPGRMLPRTAVGLYVPGAGGEVSREAAIASLQRGKVENALLGGKPSGKILVDLAFEIPQQTQGLPKPIVYVELPPPGRQPNTKRYWVAFFGGNYRGVLTSESTRIRGLVSIADIAPTLVALREGRSAPISSEPDDDPMSDLRALDLRLTQVHRVRGWTAVVVVLTLLALVAVAPRAAVVGGASAIAASLVLAWVGATRFWVVLAAMIALTAGLAIVGSLRKRLVPWTVAAFLVVFVVVLAADPELNSLGVLGARPDGGGRFYGIGNQLETLLLAPVIAAAALVGERWFFPFAALTLFTVGWSTAGADGGGVLVFGTAFAFLALRRRGLALTPRRVLLAAAGVAVVALGLIGLDAALGGSSHVTRAVGTGPGSLLGDLGHRLHLSWASATAHWYRTLTFISCLAALVWMATRRPRRPTVDAMLAALAVSLVVNDTPVDVIGLGALGCLALLRWESVDSRPMRRGALTAACLATVLVLAGCGKEGVVKPLPENVVGTVQAAAPGKAIFLNQACGSCHTYKPAGSAANGTIGPDLDKLPEYATAAKQPLVKFTEESIVNPDAHIEKGYPKGVMPKSYKDLPPNDVKALVDFLTKPQG
jgi:mono/diheme cytochrome c family protein